MDRVQEQPIYRSKSRVLAFLANNAIIVNITPKGRTTAVADAAFTSRYLIAKRGANTYSIAIAGVGDIPYGVVPDMNPTTDVDLSYPLPVNILGLNEDTERMIASSAIAIDNLLTTGAAGQIRTVPSATGTYWVIGKARTAALAQYDRWRLSLVSRIRSSSPERIPQPLTHINHHYYEKSTQGGSNSANVLRGLQKASHQRHREAGSR